MTIEITVPTLGESITEATVSQWFKHVGDSVDADEPILELETDKVTVEVPAPSAGVLSEILATNGVNVEVGAVLGSIAEGDATPKVKTNPKPSAAAEEEYAPEPANAPAATLVLEATPLASAGGATAMSPAVRKLIEQHRIDPNQMTGTGPKGRLVKADVLAYLEGKPATFTKPAVSAAAPPMAAITSAAALPERVPDPRGEEIVRMSRLRQRIAERLKQAQNSAAILSTLSLIHI